MAAARELSRESLLSMSSCQLTFMEYAIRDCSVFASTETLCALKTLAFANLLIACKVEPSQVAASLILERRWSKSLKLAWAGGFYIKNSLSTSSLTAPAS